MTFLVYGYGFIGKAFADLALKKGQSVLATARTPEKRQTLESLGIKALDPCDLPALGNVLRQATGLLITPAPVSEGCPAFTSLHDLLTSMPALWIAYLSTTGVYGDAQGKWVDEQTAPNPTSDEGKYRLLAEQQWLSLKQRHTVMIFRLPGLYGTKRNVFERLKDGTAKSILKPDQVFSRLHHEDCATGLWCAYNRPRSGAIFNLCDDEPAPADSVQDYGAKLLGLEPAPKINLEDLSISPKTRRFYQDNKRVSNALAKAELGWRPLYPNYREGLRAIMKVTEL